MERMRAGSFVAVGRVDFVEVPLPVLEDGNLLVRTDMASICGSDLHVIFQGTMHGEFPHRPGYPGHEAIGEVVESRHPDFRPGDRVLCCPDPLSCMCFAEYQAIPGNFCIKLPAYDGPDSHLLMAQQLGTVVFALRQQPVDLVGKRVMVMGQGSAGMFFAYLAKRAGAAKVIVSDLSEARLAESRRMGADVAVLATGDNVREAVLEHTDGEGADYLIEAVGKKESLLESISLAGMGAHMLMFGLPDTVDPVQLNFHDFFRKKLTMHSTYGTQHEQGRVSFRAALDMIVRKEVDVSHLVRDTYPIEKISQALHAADDRSNTALKVSVTF